MAETKLKAEVKTTKKTVSKPETTKKTTNHLVVDVYDLTGKVIGQETLNKDIFDKPASEKLLAQAIRVFSFNQRQGTVKVKGRGEVRGGGRKPWRQKGTGRARQGSIRSPQWRGGGVVHGPQPKDWSLDLSKRQRRNALLGALTLKAKENLVTLVKDFKVKEGKTKEIFDTFSKLPVGNASKTLLVLSEKDDLVLRSVRNLPNAKVEVARNLNTLEIIGVKNLLLTKDAITTMEQLLFGDQKESKSETKKVNN